MADTILLRCSSCSSLNRVPSARISAGPKCGQCKTPLTAPREPLAVSAANFDRELTAWPETLLAEFWAMGCGYCRMMEPVVKDLARWNAGRLKVVTIEINAEPALAQRFQVRGTPTFVLFQRGTQIARMDGAPKEKLDLIRWIDQYLPR